MKKKLAVAIFHGAGTPEEDFADAMISKLEKRFRKELNDKQSYEKYFVFKPIHWSTVFEKEQAELWNRLKANEDLDYARLRRFVIEFLADAIAYQPTNQPNQNYDKVHAYVASAINELKEKAGPDAPLCVISHSLGTVVASNYFYDLQYKKEKRGLETRKCTGNSPLEQCETLSLFYTTGSPLALWSLRYIDFGAPITVPSDKIKKLYPQLQGEWINFYDKDDVLAFPLKHINETYNQAVTKDISVNAGGIITSWNPLSHFHYDKNEKVIKTIAKSLVETWRTVNR
ncbi:chemotaxis protein [Oceanobacillus halophilus]|uniref:Chemotaxis protein n=1 Tax=Oceanobacillus halophilus TaxID=930130 RepID=A0A495A783_9BACI|nr:chemotaxis protein [Oceanobacillus halophilus]RKQ35660.1 chemotaxis protein [Oceanobacillus halophilus]